MSTRVRKNPVMYGCAGVIVVVGLLWWSLGNKEAGPQTLVAAPAEFVQSVSVSGTVVPAQSVELGFAQSGRVTGVYTAVGRAAAPGTLLAQVENGDLRAAVTQREAALETEEAELAELKGGTRPEEVAVAEAQVAADEVALQDAVQEAYSAADDAVRNQVDQFLENPRTAPSLTFDTTDATIESLVAQKRLAMESTLTAWTTALQGGEPLGAAVSRAQSALTGAVSLLADANAALNRAITNATTPQSTVSAYIADVGSARSAVQSALSALNAAQTTLATDKETLALKRAGSTPSAIASQAARVKAAQADLDAARANLGKTLILAPFSGIVTRVDAKVGAIASAGTTQLAMNSQGAFQIESYVPEIHVSKLVAGQEADIVLDAYGEEQIFNARIVSVDPAQTVRDGVSTYRAILEFASPDTRIRAGMTANITIITLSKTDVISVPDGAITTRDGKKFVTVLVDESPVEREVVVGELSSRGEREILSGVAQGDIVVLP